MNLKTRPRRNLCQARISDLPSSFVVSPMNVFLCTLTTIQVFTYPPSTKWTIFLPPILSGILIFQELESRFPCFGKSIIFDRLNTSKVTGESPTIDRWITVASDRSSSYTSRMGDLH
ncbi:hypothetical protein CY34DRAFT_562211 [Suillus luteus UH-Slu-Lm8-n1]|uniref:Uncharacterized protein n=1 Tax=Suillus luteus UH-Slu-Lm8-n1 TaxID=930992 RepID=A0A0D0AUX9_9AGAM|nr:hypothetical protein CY34DRAFT_562211 [Suillus luteus UH-Slu-Lm8-n1]